MPQFATDPSLAGVSALGQTRGRSYGDRMIGAAADIRGDLMAVSNSTDPRQYNRQPSASAKSRPSRLTAHDINEYPPCVSGRGPKTH